MLDTIFNGVFDSGAASSISVSSFLLCVAVALAIGLVLAFSYTYQSRYTKSFVVTLALIPTVVCVVIMMVNGSIGAGVAVAGAFNLVRFRSVPGSAKEIGAIFLAMGAGLAVGMGYLAYGVLFAVILGAVTMLYNKSRLGENKPSLDKTLRITIPEDLDYTGVFDDLLEEYTKKYEVVQVKSVNMGSLFKLTYQLTLKDAAKEKEFLDALRCRNGNLEITLSKQETNAYEL